MQERINCITHGFGAILSIVGFVVLVIMADKSGDIWRIISFSIYGATLFLLYLTSSIYHGLTNIKIKQIFQILDHSAIYLLIAGSYTPITLIPLRGAWGWTLFGLVWGIALMGIIIKFLFFEKTKMISLILYILMGWLIVIAIKPLIASIPMGMFLWIVLGGLSYSIGILFFIAKKIPYHHSIWHLFVLGGSITHFLGIVLYLA
ncbi:MAG: hemolysin III family protein [Candidatus Atribacteria bacterium]|nr:hemolysin III family protein [Candidatus Atribacteria bacterium]